MAAITEAMHDHIAAPRAAVRVWITEFPSTDYMAGGELLADKQTRLANSEQRTSRPTPDRSTQPNGERRSDP